jgi:hypothetical protein
MLAVLFLLMQAAAAAPFELVHDAIVLDVSVNGHGPYKMLLDTGSDPSAIDAGLAKELGLKFGGSGLAEGGGTEKTEIRETKLPSVQVGALAAKDVAAVAVDLTRIAAAMKLPICGVLGHSFLVGHVVQIDYPARVLRFVPAAPPLREGDARVPFRYDDDILLDDVTVNGTKVVADLDTGSNGTFKMTPAAAETLGIDVS